MIDFKTWSCPRCGSSNPELIGKRGGSILRCWWCANEWLYATAPERLALIARREAEEHL